MLLNICIVRLNKASLIYHVNNNVKDNVLGELKDLKRYFVPEELNRKSMFNILLVNW